MWFFGKRKYKKYQNLIFENSQEFFLIFDMLGNIHECNKKAIQELGYGDEIYHTPIYNIFQNAFSYNNNKLSVLPQYQSAPGEAIAYRKNQTCFPVMLSVSIIEDKELVRGLCSAINVSERNEAIRTTRLVSKELEEYQQRRNEFVANITHELRTPVNGIVGLSDNLLETSLTKEQSEAVLMIKHCCTGMNTLINNLLDYAKLSNNKLILEEREFSFHGFIRQIIELNKNKIIDKGLKLITNISYDIPDRMLGDEFRLAQILNNLFSNAIKFTDDGQIVLEVVKLWQTDHLIELYFMVTDTGIGIDISEKELIFQSFTQADGSISRKYGGTGLGLAICKSLVESMHGTITVDSIKNKGSNFSFSIHLGLPENCNKNMYAQSTSTKQEFDNTLQKNSFSLQGVKENDKEQILAVLERLYLCIDMESWEMAEELAYKLNNNVPHNELKKETFRLLLSVRKGAHDSSLAILHEIRAILNETNYMKSRDI